MGLYQTAKGHTDRINALTFIKRGSGLNQKDIALLTGSADKTCRLWTTSDNGKTVRHFSQCFF